MMPQSHPSRALLLLLASGAAILALGQGTMPPTKPSAAIPMGPQPQMTAPVTAAKASSHRAKVKYIDGRLTIEADNSSLNQILREIGQQSGIKITGGVADERVFGTYGPDVPSRILASLLDGTDSNMLFLASKGSFSGELVLSPRTGGATPPNPNAERNREEEDVTIDRPPDAQNRIVAGPTPQQTSTPPAAVAPGVAPDPGAPAAPAADSTTAQSPNGVKTPQQIYDQLIQLQKQQQQTTTPP